MVLTLSNLFKAMSNHSIFSGLPTSISSELLLEDQLSAKRDFIMSVVYTKGRKVFIWARDRKVIESSP